MQSALLVVGCVGALGAGALAYLLVQDWQRRREAQGRGMTNSFQLVASAILIAAAAAGLVVTTQVFLWMG